MDAYTKTMDTSLSVFMSVNIIGRGERENDRIDRRLNACDRRLVARYFSVVYCLADLGLYLALSEKRSITRVFSKNLALCFAPAGMTYSVPFSHIVGLSLMVNSILPSTTMPHCG